MNEDIFIIEGSSVQKDMFSTSEKSSNQYKKEATELRHKVNQLEFNLAEQSAVHNKEIGILQESIAKLNASFEKNEVLRQKLEYELASSNQKFSQLKRSAAKKEEELEAVIIELKEQVMKNNEIIQEKEKQLHNFTISIQTEGKVFLEQIQIKDAIISELKKENEVLYDQKMNGDNMCIAVKKQIKEHRKECKMLQKQLLSNNEFIKKLEKENSMEKDEKQETSKLLQNLNKQIKNLEEELQHEHATQLKLKNEAETLQLTVKELNSLLSAESLHYKKSVKNLDDLTEKYKELVSTNSNEVNIHNQLKIVHSKLLDDHKLIQDSLSKLKEQYISDNKKIMEELASKTKDVADANVDVSIYKKNLNEVQKELTECKRKLLEMEKIYTKKCKLIAEDLKNVLYSYKISDLCDFSEIFDLNDLVACIKQVFNDYQVNMAKLEGKIKDDDALLKKLAADNKTQKEIVCDKNMLIEETEKELINSKNYIARNQVFCTELEEKIKQMITNENLLQEDLKDKHEKISALKIENNLQKEDMVDFLRMICILFGHDFELVDPSIVGIQRSKDILLNHLREKVVFYKDLSKNVLEFEKELTSKNETFLQQKHALNQLQNLNTQVLTMTKKGLLNEKETWLREKDFLIKKNIEEKKDVQEACELALKKNLEHQVVLQESLQNHKLAFDKMKEYQQHLVEDNELLRIALTVITGGFWGYFVNNQYLLMEKAIQGTMIKYLLNFKDKIIFLNETLNAEMCFNSKIEQQFTGIFRFRLVVIAVMVVNRLLCWKQSTLTMKYSYKGKIYCSENNMISWLNSRQYEHAAKLAALPIFKKMQQIEVNLNSSDLVDIVGSCFCEYCDIVQKQYPMNMKKSSLIELLGNGLKSLLQSRNNFTNSNDSVLSLNSMILQFTQRLHTTELERKNLLREKKHFVNFNNKMEKSLLKEKEHNSALQTQEKKLRDKIHELEVQLKSTVKEEKFQNVCRKLSEALKKEEELETIFQEQTKKIKEMTEKINIHSEFYSKNDMHVTQVMEDLLTCQLKAKQAEDKVTGLVEVINRISLEKKTLSQTLSLKSLDVEKLIRERDSLVYYLQNVATTIHENNIQVLKKKPYTIDMEVALLKLPPEVLTTLNETPELQIVQKTVDMILSIQKNTFFEISRLRSEKHSMRSKINLLEKDIIAHRKHVALLKKQMSDVCQVDLKYSQDSQFESEHLIRLYEEKVFVPLRAQHEEI